MVGSCSSCATDIQGSKPEQTLDHSKRSYEEIWAHDSRPWCRSWWLIHDTSRRSVIWGFPGSIMWCAVVFPLVRPQTGCVMSVQSRPWPEPAKEIVSAVRANYARRRAPLAVQIRDQLGELFPDVEFE